MGESPDGRFNVDGCDQSYFLPPNISEFCSHEACFLHPGKAPLSSARKAVIPEGPDRSSDKQASVLGLYPAGGATRRPLGSARGPAGRVTAASCRSGAVSPSGQRG